MKFLVCIVIVFWFTTNSNAQTQKTDTIIDYIKSETINGKLDFKQILINQGQGKIMTVYDGVGYNPDHFAIFLWGQAMRRFGIRSLKETRILWEEIYQREMIKPEKRALKNGYKANVS